MFLAYANNKWRLLNTPLLAAMESAPHHRERRVREAAKNYANHQRATAKRKLKRFKTNASKNRVMYYSARRESCWC